MKVKHGGYVEPDNAHSLNIAMYWMGERVDVDDFNERLRNQTASAGKDIIDFCAGFDAKESLNAGQKTLSELHALEEVARLPLCDGCRKLIGDIQ